MDPLHDKDTDQNSRNEAAPIVCTREAGKMIIQLEGSHLTSTNTEALPSGDKKNVKFQDQNEKESSNKEDILQKAEANLSGVLHNEAICLESTNTKSCKYPVNSQLKQANSNTALIIYKDVASKTFEDKIGKPGQDIELKYFKSAEIAEKTSQFRSIAMVTTSCDSESVACQTQPADHTSLNELSLLEISSFTSRSDQANSLNNYAQAENACISNYDSQQGIVKRPSQTPLIVQPMVDDRQAPPRTPSFNVITIEAEGITSLTELRRPPLCHRVWNVFCEFCAATLLCLQVNRDCIFCLGFLAAFVVSASFLTAFFYHTLMTSPSLWQPAENAFF